MSNNVKNGVYQTLLTDAKDLSFWQTTKLALKIQMALLASGILITGAVLLGLFLIYTIYFIFNYN